MIIETDSRATTLAILDQDSVFHFIVEKSLPYWAPDAKFRILDFSSVEKLLAYLLDNADQPNQIPDIIFSEINMNPLDGWAFLDLYDRIKDLLSKKPTIYVVSSSVLDVDKQQVLSYNFVCNYFEKPLTKEKFNEIKSIFEDRSLNS